MANPGSGQNNGSLSVPLLHRKMNGGGGANVGGSADDLNICCHYEQAK